VPYRIFILSGHGVLDWVLLDDGELPYIDKAKSFFDLGIRISCLVFLYRQVAIPSVGATRSPIEEKVKWIEY
jgi:hypothetical protein